MNLRALAFSAAIAAGVASAASSISLSTNCFSCESNKVPASACLVMQDVECKEEAENEVCVKADGKAQVKCLAETPEGLLNINLGAAQAEYSIHELTLPKTKQLTINGSPAVKDIDNKLIKDAPELTLLKIDHVQFREKLEARKLNTPHLEVLVVTKCGLQALPWEITDLEALAELELDNNNFEEFEYKSESVYRLSIQDNKLKKFSPKMSSLRELYMARNQLGSLELDLRELEKLNVADNKLAKFHGKLPYLTNLQLQNNGLEKIQISLSTSLLYLNLERNHLENFDGLQLSSLLEFNMQHNILKAFEGDLYKFDALKKLFLANNQIKKFTGNYPELRELYLQNNPLEIYDANTPKLEKWTIDDEKLMKGAGSTAAMIATSALATIATLVATVFLF